VHNFLVVERTDLNDASYRGNLGCTYTEEALRIWAHDTFEADTDAPLEEISFVIESRGWMMFQHIPSVSEEKLLDALYLSNTLFEVLTKLNLFHRVWATNKPPRSGA